MIVSIISNDVVFVQDEPSLEVIGKQRELKKGKYYKGYYGYYSKSSKKSKKKKGYYYYGSSSSSDDPPPGPSSDDESSSSSYSKSWKKSKKNKSGKSDKSRPTRAPVAPTQAPASPVGQPTPAPVSQPTPRPVAPTPAPIRPTRAPTNSPTAGFTSAVIFVCSDDCGAVAADVTQADFVDALGPNGEAIIAGGNACGQVCNPGPGRRQLQTAPTGVSQLTILNLVSFDLDEQELLQLCIDNLPGTSSLTAPPTFPPTETPTVSPTDAPSSSPSISSEVPSADPTSSGYPTVSQSPSSAPSVELVTVTVQSAVVSPLTNTTAVTEAYTTAVNDVSSGQGITVRRRLQPGTNITYTCNCVQDVCTGSPAECIYTCTCVSEGVTKTVAIAAETYLESEADEIAEDLVNEGVIGGAGDVFVSLIVSTKAPTSAPTVSQYPTANVPRRLSALEIQKECECNLDGISVTCVAPEDENTCSCDNGQAICEE